MRNEHPHVVDKEQEQIEHEKTETSEDSIVIEEIVPDDTTAFIMSAGALSTYEY